MGGRAALGVRDTLVSLSFGFTAPVLLHVMFTLNYGTSPLGGVLIESPSLYGLYHNEGGWPSNFRETDGILCQIPVVITGSGEDRRVVGILLTLRV